MPVINIDTHFNKKRDMNPNEALELLKMSGIILMSWGAQQFTTIGKTQYGCKALRFKVNGYLHKGYVFLSVNGNDLYDFTLTKLNGEIVHEQTDIYFDELVEQMDFKIETKQTCG